MIVVVKLDLDRYDAKTIAKLVEGKIITVEEALESKAIKELNDVARLFWKREVAA